MRAKKLNFTQKSWDLASLARATNTTHDGGDDRLHYDGETISVFANLMTRKEYKAMEKAIKDTHIKRKSYEVYAWNDVSGYEYWKEEGENHSSNYIQVTVHVKDPAKIDASKLKKDIETVFNALCGYDNMQDFLQYLNEKRLAGAK